MADPDAPHTSVGVMWNEMYPEAIAKFETIHSQLYHPDFRTTLLPYIINYCYEDRDVLTVLISMFAEQVIPHLEDLDDLACCLWKCHPKSTLGKRPTILDGMNIIVAHCDIFATRAEYSYFSPGVCILTDCVLSFARYSQEQKEKRGTIEVTPGTKETLTRITCFANNQFTVPKCLEAVAGYCASEKISVVSISRPENMKDVGGSKYWKCYESFIYDWANEHPEIKVCIHI